MQSADRDRNLLFGIFAAQLKGVRPERVIDAGAGWAVDPTRSLPDRLVEAGVLSEEDRAFLDRLVDEAVRAHGGAVDQALETLGGAKQVHETFQGTLRPTPEGGVETVQSDRTGEPQVLSDLSLPAESPGRYLQISVYGRGGMGRVLLVHDEQMDRDVALKELLPRSERHGELDWSPVGHTASMVARFLREARLTGLLEHPSIVPVYELGRRPDGSLYYTMKLVRGKTFLQAIREGKQLQDRLALVPNFLSLCHAIAYAHSRGVIHRDIKPANVMIGDFGETVVLDWGIAKAQGSADLHEIELAEAMTALQLDDHEYTVQTEAGEALGTPHYMPPEQAEGRVAEIDKRSDVYSLGAVLYELLTGKTPHGGRTTREILLNVMRAPIRPVRNIIHDAPPELAVIAEKCLQKDPAQRYGSARELADEIERFLSGALVRSYRYSPRQILLHYYRRHRAVLNTAMAGAAALLLLAVYSYISLSRAYEREQEQRQYAEIARDEAEVARDLEEWERYRAQIQLLKAYIDAGNFTLAQRLIWEVPGRYRDWEWGHLLSRCNEDIETLAEHGAPVGKLLFTRDGGRFLTYSGDATARWWDAESRQVLSTIRLSGFWAEEIGISPDASGAVFGLQSGDVVVHDLASGEERVRLQGHTGAVNAAVYSPDGAGVISASNDGTVRIWDLATAATQQRIEPGEGELWRAEPNPDSGVLLVQAKNNKVLVYTLDGAQRMYERSGRMARFSPAMDRLALIAEDGVHLLDVKTGELLHRLEAQDRVARFAFSRDGSLLAVGTDSGGVEVYTAEGERVVSFTLEEAVSECGFNDAGDVLFACAGRNGQVRFYDVKRKRISGRFAGHTGTIKDAVFRPGTEVLFTAGWDHTVKLWHPIGYPARQEVQLHPRDIYALAFSGDGSTLATGAADRTLRIAPSDSLRPQQVFAAYSAYGPERMALNKEGTRAAALLDGALPLVLDATTGRLQAIFHGHTNRPRCIAYAPMAEEAATGDWGGKVYLWDTTDGEPRLQLEIGEGYVTALAYSPDGTRLAVGESIGAIGIWHTGTGERLMTLESAPREVVRLRWGPDGETIAGATVARTLVWDTASGKLRVDVPAGERMGAMDLTPAGNRLIAGADGGGLMLWSVATGQEMFKVETAQTSLLALASQQTQGRVYFTGRQGTLGYLEASPWSPDSLPGASDLSWEERYAQYKRQRSLAAFAPEGTGAPVPLTIFTTSPRIREQFETLRNGLEQLAPDDAAFSPAGLRLTAGPVANSMAMLCLMEEDLIPDMNGVRIDSRASALQAIAAVAEQTLQPGDTLSFALVRGETPFTARYQVLKERRRQLEKRFTIAEGLAAITATRTYLQQARESLVMVNQEHARKAGYPLESRDALYGYYLAPPGREQLQEAYRHLGLAPLDHLRRVNGQPIDGFSRLHDLLNTIEAQLQAGESVALQATLDRGVFEAIDLTLLFE